MFSTSIMASVAYVAASVSRFVCMEVVELLRTAFRHRTGITVMRIIAVVDMAVKAGAPVKPGAGSNK